MRSTQKNEEKTPAGTQPEKTAGTRIAQPGQPAGTPAERPHNTPK